MEEIKIDKIDEKPSGLVIITYNGRKEATMNVGWQAQEVDFLKKDVGIGGSCKVKIEQKGKYTNITSVDMESAKPDANYKAPVEVKPKFGNNDSIVAQCMVKAAASVAATWDTNGWEAEKIGELMCALANEMFGAYKVVLDKLE